MPKVTTINATEMHNRRGALLKRCARNGEQFIIEKNGILVAALIPIETYRQKIEHGGTDSQSDD